MSQVATLLRLTLGLSPKVEIEPTTTIVYGAVLTMPFISSAVSAGKLFFPVALKLVRLLMRTKNRPLFSSNIVQ